MFLAYQAYKKHQQKKKGREASTANGPYERKLSESSNVSPVSMESHPVTSGGGPPPAFIWKEDKAGSTKRQWIMLGLTLLIDVALPIMLYYILKEQMSLLAALLISSAPPCAMVLFKAIFTRKVDPLGLIIICSFVISAAVSVVDSNPRILLFKDSITTGCIGTIFLSSLLPLKVGKFRLMPITYGVSAEMLATQPHVHYLKDGVMVEQEFPSFLWEHSRHFRKGQRLLTGGWGTVLLLELLAKLTMYFSSLTIDQLFLYGNVVAGVLLGSMGLLTMVSSPLIRKYAKQDVIEVRQRIEAEAAMAATASESYDNAGASA